MDLRFILLSLLFVYSHCSQLCKVIDIIKERSKSPDIFADHLQNCFPKYYDDCNTKSEISLKHKSDLILNSNSENGAFLKNISFSNFASYKLNNGFFSMKISCQFQAFADIRVDYNYKDIRLTGEISAEILDLPLSAIDHYNPFWIGYIKSLPNQKILFSDFSLFDGHRQTFFIATKYPTISFPSGVLNYTITSAADINVRLGPMNSLISHQGKTIRGLFLPSSVLPPSTQISPFGKNSILTQSSYSCQGSQCPLSMIGATQSLISDLSNCTQIYLVSYAASLSLDMVIDSDSIDIQSLVASTQAIFGCSGDRQGYISIFLSASTPQLTSWPLVEYLSDPKAASGLVKSSPLIRGGYMTGYLQDSNGNIFTITSQDLFSASRGGLLVPDVPVTSQSVDNLQNLFNQIGSTASTGRSAVDNFIINSFSDVTLLFDQYMNQTINGTERGFIQYYAMIHNSSIQIHFSEDGQIVTVTFTLPISTPINASDSIIEEANALLLHFANETMHQLNEVNFGYPVITSSTPLDANITGFVVASVDIIGYGSIFNFSLNSMQFSGTSDISASFPSSNVFIYFSMFLDLQTGYYSLKGITPANLGSYFVQEDDNGVISLSQTWNIPPSSVSSQFLQLKDAFTNFTNQRSTLLPTTIDVFSIGVSRWLDIGALLNASIFNLPAGTPSYVIENTIENTLSSLMGENSYVHSKVIASTPGSIDLHIQYRVLQNFKINTDNTIWKAKLDTMRLNLAIITSTEVIFSISQDGLTFGLFAASGTCQLNRFNIPLVKGMIAGSVTNGTITITVDEQDTLGNSIIQLIASAETNVPNITLQATLTDSNLLQHSSVANFQVSPDCDRMAPELITSSIVDGFFNMFMMAFKYSLNFVVPPFQSNLSSISELPSGIARITPWLYIPVASNPVIATSGSFCTPFNDQIVLSLQWNSQPNTSCTINIDSVSLQDTVQQLNNGIENCGLENIITSQVQNTDDDCGTIQFFQANPGLIWSFSMNISGVANSSNFWISQTVPSYNNWEDMAIYYAVLLQLEDINVQPVYSTLSTTEAPYLVDPALVPFYPSEFRTVSVRLTVDVTNQANVPTSNQISVSNSSMYLSLNGGAITGTLHSWLESNIVVALGTPPYGGGNNLSVFTNFSSPYGTQEIITSDSNTFVLYLEAEIRSNSLQVNYVTGTFPIVLSVGSTVYDAFTNDIISSVDDPTFSSLLQVIYIPARNFSTLSNNSLFISYEQMKISASRIITNGTLILPRLISIQNSTLPFLNNRTLIFPTFQIVAENASIGIDASMDLNTIQTSGAIGIVAMNSTNTSGNLNISVSASSPGYQSFSKLFLSTQNSSTFFNLWNTLVSVDNEIIVDEIELAIDLNSIGGELTSALTIENEWQINSEQDFINMKNELNWSSSYPNGHQQVLSGLEQTSSDTFCIWFHMLDKKISNLVTELPYGKNNLPLVSKSIYSLWQGTIGKTLSSIEQKLCNNSKVQSTIKDLCALMNGVFGTNACSYSNISDVVLSVNMNFQLDNSFATKLLLNTPAIYADNSLPIGIGASEDLTISTVLDATITLLVEFNDGHITVDLAPGTGFELEIQAKALGNLRVSFGPLVITLGNLDAIVGNPLVLSIGIDQEKQVDFGLKGTASLSADIESYGIIVCQMQITCTSVDDYIQGNYSTTTHSEIACNGDDFAELLAALLDENSFEDYLVQDFLVASQLIAAFDDIIDDNLWGAAGVLIGLDIPLIRKEIQLLLRKELRGFLSPPLLKQFSSQLTRSVLDIILHGNNYNESVLDQILLEAFTKVFCNAFKEYLLSCPPVPVMTDSGFNMTVAFGRTYKYPITEMNWHLGENGVADLKLSCAEYLVITWEMQFTIHFDFVHGIQIFLDQHPFLNAQILLTFSQKCKLAGDLIFAGFDIDPQGQLTGQIYVDYNSGFTADATVSAKMTGRADLGFAGFISEAIDNSNSPEALPFFRFHPTFAWEWDMDQDDDTTPNMTIGSVNICVGYAITRMLKQFLIVQINPHILQKVDEFIGPNGMLLRPIPATGFLFGSSLNAIQLAEFVTENFCDDCRFDPTVWEAIEILGDIVDIIDLITELENSDPDGCGVYTAVEEFWINWDNPNPFPIPSNPSQSNIQFNESIDPSYYDAYTSVYGYTVQEEGSFGITFPFITHPAQAIISIIIGGSFDILQLNFPEFVISVVPPPLDIPVWPFPEVDIFVGFGMGITFQMPPITITSDVFKYAIFSFSPQKLLGSFQIQTKTANGAELWPITGYATIYGGVSVDIFIFSGSAYVSITLTASLGFPNVNNQDYISFEQIYWVVQQNGGDPLNAISWDIQLTAGFGIEIQACIHLLFFHHCWTLAHWQWSATLWSDEYIATLINPAAYPDGTIVTGPILSKKRSPFQMYGQFNIYEATSGITVVDKYPEIVDPYSSTQPPLSLAFPNNVLSTTGTEPYLWVLSGVTSPFNFPGGASSLQLNMNKWNSVNEFIISGTQVAPANYPGVVISSCSSLSLLSPGFGNTIAMNGVPCSALFEVEESSTVIITGDPSIYIDKSINLNGTNLGTLNVQATATVYYISDSQIIGNNNELEITLPENTLTLQVNSNPILDSTFIIESVPSYQTATFIGGYGADEFIFTLGSCIGNTYLVGAQNFNSFNILIDGNDGLNAIATSNSIIQMDDLGNTNRVTFTSIQNQNYQLQVDDGNSLSFTLVNPIEDAFITINSQGSQGTSTYIYLPRCGSQTSVRINMTNPGQNILILGNNGQINELLCPIEVIGLPGNDNTVFIYSENDLISYGWDFVSNQLRVSPPNTDQGILTLDYSGIDKMIVFFGSGNNSLLMKTPSSPTEFVFSFPEETPSLNFVQIIATLTSVFLNGTFEDLVIGPTSTYPMFYVTGSLIVVGDHSVYLNGESSSTGQHYLISTSTLNPTDSNGIIPPLTDTSLWMQEIMVENGFTVEESLLQAHLHYLGNTTFWISTGDGDDSVISNQINANLNLSFGNGDDLFFHNNSASHLFCNADMGIGWDKAILGADVSLSNIYLGEDHDGDFLDVYTENYMANIVDNMIYPTGPFSDDYVQIFNWFVEDSVTTQEGAPPNYVNETIILSVF